MADSAESVSSMEIAKQWHELQGMYRYEDMWLSCEINQTLLARIKAFQFDERDILISTYPRSGTTWSQEITWLICNNADVDTARQVDLEVRSRFIDYSFKRIGTPNIDFLEKTPAPRVIKTHFPPQFFETQRRQVQFKTIVVMRNLKDVLVSSFHFYKDLMYFKGTWDDFFELFKNDMMLYGSWAKHCLKCWELRDDPNVLFLKFEDLKANPTKSIKKMANFCGKSLSEEEEKAIVGFTSIDNMRDLNINSARVAKTPNEKNLIRKGVVGNWKQLFNDEQLKYVSELTRATTEKEGLVFTDLLG